ncbi:fimbrial protein [Pantoea ananatis]|uniref:fimbrial protein n=1 Tax=Pantoea ananas TaxID=553 RepID=UPI0021E8291D|nr:fimbrial protein [Pantoea ananatis]UYL01868.1 fimbrial protein [Pantoea ananatis]
MKSRKIIFSIRLFIIVLTMTSAFAHAGESECTSDASDIRVILNDTKISKEDNHAGYLLTSATIDRSMFSTTCNDGMVSISYNTSLPVNYDGFSLYKKIKINDYIYMVVRPTININGNPVIYSIPGSAYSGIITPNIEKSVTYQVRLLKPIDGKVSINDITVYTGNFKPYPGAPNGASYNMSISGNISKRAMCEISDKDLSFNFLHLDPVAFQKAGTGNKPAGVNPVTKHFTVQCSGSASLNWSVAEIGHINKMIIAHSNNPSDGSVGFVIADGDGNPVTPGDTVKNVQISDTGAKAIDVQAWPVSANGERPAGGDYNAIAYLRISYD